MKLKRLLIAIVMFAFVGSIYAESEVQGFPKSEYEDTIFSHNRVEISNKNEDGEYIKDSKIQIQDEEGKVIYEFSTPKEDYVIERLEEGTYYLVQTSVPADYELNSNKIKFEVNNSVVNLEIVNKKTPQKNEAMTPGNTMLLFMAMLNITIGLGILGYVKSKKIKK